METPNHLISGFHFRGKLPHIKRVGATYFVTFRLADSLPAAAITRLKQEREHLLQHALAAKRPLTWAEEQQLYQWYAAQVDAQFDQGHGSCWLHRPEIAKLVADALLFFQNQRYELSTWVIMPNHVHALVKPRPEFELSDILHSWKSFTAHAANKVLQNTGNTFWQTESYDHWVRDVAEHAAIARYISNNPVTSGLCPRPEDWPWSSAHPR
jgi:REP element-mobilizing transposase RayT